MTFAITFTQDCDHPRRIERSDVALDLTSVGSIHIIEKKGLGVVVFEGLETFSIRLNIRAREEYFYCDGTSFDGEDKLSWLYPIRPPIDKEAIARLEDYIGGNCR
ncbi:hypothetical protein [Rubellimicrobium aerolatum]|uniref:Uncharacterized protein n=1 Tax=Rubellimicrobium aerolatum TaxID=490979 RepID=A0ABW0SI07_9RHOB|nr:hypothetical protein [Rubellimicrobium aerolatum]MBP1807550.1 hypothetical protein [Rubellimicrobium aerolatum]